MPVELTDNIAPSGDSGGTPATFSTHLDIYGNGGYRAVANENERLGVSGLLTQLRRKLGMAVYQQDTSKLYILTTNPATATTTNTDWTEFTGGSGGNLQDTMDLGSTATGLTTDVDITTSGDMSLTFGSTAVDQFNLIGGNISVQSGYGIDIDSTAGDITLSGTNLIVDGTGLGTPSIGDVLSAADASGTLTWTTLPSESDLQSVLENGSQFSKPNGYTGGVLYINYSGVTSNPSNPASNTTGILIDANSTGTNTGENLMIAASGSADAAFVKLHAQNTNNLPGGFVPYSRLEVGQSDIVVDTNSTTWQNKQVGDVITIKSVSPGVGTNGSEYVIGPSTVVLTPDMQDVFNNSTPGITATDATKKLSLSAGDVDILTDNSSGGTSKIALQASNSTAGYVNELNIDATTNLTTLTTENLNVEIRSSNTTAGPEVGDVLMIDSLQGAGSTYGRLKYKTGVQLKRQTITTSELRNLFTTTVPLLSGIPSRYLMILQAYVVLQSPNVPYNAGVKLEIQQDAFSIPILQTNEFLQSTFQGARTFYPMDPSTILPDECPVSSSAGWKLACTADPGNLGDGYLKIWITYMVLP